ncbi:MAG: HAD-IC family P-type ATPase [Oscillospiraceae bacterium]
MQRRSPRARPQEAVKYYTVFGRVTPEQKRYLVRAFQKQGHTVAMTGDGVNDVLALKDANCGIAMASGSQAASQVAQIVLLNSQFSAMPAIVAEGRRVINNIQRAASLFLVKNIFSFALTLLLLFIDMPYPLLPIQLSLISTFTIGIPSFFLALEPNYARVEGKFMRNVIRRAMPGGLTNLTIVLLAGFFTSTFGLSNEQLNTICVWVMSAVGLVTLYHVSVPFTRLPRCAGCHDGGVLFSLLVIGVLPPALNASSALILVTLLLACPTVMRFFRVIFDKRVAKLDLAPAKKQKKRHRFEK